MSRTESVWCAAALALAYQVPIQAQFGGGMAGPDTSGAFAAANVFRTVVGDPNADASAGPLALTPFHPLVEELYSVTTERKTEKDASKDKANKGGEGKAEDGERPKEEYVKRQGYVVLRSFVKHPQPSLRHATARYKSFGMDYSRQSEIRHVIENKIIGKFEFEETSLRDVIEVIEASLNPNPNDPDPIPVVIDDKALEAANLTRDTPITEKLSGISLRSALRNMLGKVDLTYVVKDEVLRITTKEQAEQELEVRVYPVSQFYGNPQSVVDLIETTIAPTTWNAFGGVGACIAIDDHSLVVNQTQEVHEKLEELLRGIFDQEFAPPSIDDVVDPTRVPTRTYVIRDAKVLQELGQKLKKICNAGLGDSGDSEAVIETLGGQLIVQSKKRSFHVYAAEVIQSINGLEAVVAEYYGVTGDRRPAVIPDLGGSKNPFGGMGAAGGFQ